MLKKLIITTVADFAAILASGCVITIEERCDRHPDRCYDCHYSWELDKLSVEVTCKEYEITIVSNGYWYKPVGADDTQKKFQLLKAHESGTVLGPDSP
jgi:hypothetical protein